MAATASSVRRNDVTGNLKFTVTDVTCDASYVTGGYAITPAQLGLNDIFLAWAQIKTTAAAGAGVEPFYDEVNDKLKINAAAAEVANASNLATMVVRVFAVGA